jgi:hypothetical protein
MIGPAYCNGCGKRLEVPAGYGKSKIRCPDCGVFTELPKEIREQGQSSGRPDPPPAAKPAPPPPPVRAKPAPLPPVGKPASAEDEDTGAYAFREEPEPDAPDPPRRAKPAPETSKSRGAKPVEKDPAEDDDIPEREVLITGTEEDDLNPYTVTGDAPTKPCPECDRRVPVRDEVCNRCGYNFATRERAKRTYEPVHLEWEEGWPFERRVMIFVGAQVLNFISLAALMISGQGTTSFILVVMTFFLQAFLLGTYQKLSLDRTTKGKITLNSRWRVAFLAQPSKPARWKEHESLIIVRSNEFNPIDVCFALILLLYCVIPGVLFWWFVIHSDKFTITLCKDHGFPETPIFRTLSEERAKEIMQTVSDVTTLPIRL